MDLNSMEQVQTVEEFPAEEKARIDAKVREHEKLVNIASKVSMGLDLAAAVFFIIGILLIEASVAALPAILGYVLIVISVVFESIQIFGTLIFNCVIDMITKLGTKTWIENSGVDAKGYLARFGAVKIDNTMKKWSWNRRQKVDLLENFKLATMMTEKPNEKTVTLVCCVFNIICGATVGVFSVLFSLAIIAMYNSTFVAALDSMWYVFLPFILALLIAIVNLVLQALQRSRVKKWVEELRASVVPKAEPVTTEAIQADAATVETDEVTPEKNEQE